MILFFDSLLRILVSFASLAIIKYHHAVAFEEGDHSSTASVSTSKVTEVSAAAGG